MKKKFFAVFSAIVLTFAISSTAQAGSAFLTGHDVLLHRGQNGYGGVILDYLRGAGTASEIAKASYDVGYIGFGSTLGITSPGYGVTAATAASFGSEAVFATWLSSRDALVIPWTYSTTSSIINSYSGSITSFFNTGGDIWANSSHINTTFYDFLPPGATATGPALPGNPSSGFVTTPEGTAIAIASNNINGFATHNSFDSFDPAFTVFERYRSQNGPVISIGLRDARIVDGGFEPDAPLPDEPEPTGGEPVVPEPASMLLLGSGLLGMAGFRRKK